MRDKGLWKKSNRKRSSLQRWPFSSWTFLKSFFSPSNDSRYIPSWGKEAFDYPPPKKNPYISYFPFLPLVRTDIPTRQMMEPPSTGQKPGSPMPREVPRTGGLS